MLAILRKDLTTHFATVATASAVVFTLLGLLVGQRLIEGDEVQGRLEGIAHLGIACASRREVDELCARARAEDALALEPRADPGPAGYWGLLRDPDGHNVELSYGQEVGRAVSEARAVAPPAAPPG